jgi:hypothetical protein
VLGTPDEAQLGAPVTVAKDGSDGSLAACRDRRVQARLEAGQGGANGDEGRAVVHPSIVANAVLRDARLPIERIAAGLGDARLRGTGTD